MTRIGTTEAKTQLPKLLDRVAAGESIIITRGGEEVARLVPPPAKKNGQHLREAVQRWKSARKGVKLGRLKLRDLIDEGRA